MCSYLKVTDQIPYPPKIWRNTNFVMFVLRFLNSRGEDQEFWTQQQKLLPTATPYLTSLSYQNSEIKKKCHNKDVHFLYFTAT
jgi:hypothetical protein